MSNKLLNRFFQMNGDISETPSAAYLAHFQMTLDRNPGADAIVQEKMFDVIYKEQPERIQIAAADKAEVAAVQGSVGIVRLMRRKIAFEARRGLIDKALKLEDEVLPDVIRRLKTNMIDEFIEISVRFLSLCQKDITDELVKLYNETYNPYTQSQLLIVLGFRAGEDLIPWMIEQYDMLKKRYPEETYCEGAYYGLVEMDNRLNFNT
jgi:hypothetical protein